MGWGGSASHASELMLLSGDKPQQRCSASLTAREMQIKSTARHHLAHVTSTVTKKTTDRLSLVAQG